MKDITNLNRKNRIETIRRSSRLNIKGVSLWSNKYIFNFWDGANVFFFFFLNQDVADSNTDSTKIKNHALNFISNNVYNKLDADKKNTIS